MRIPIPKLALMASLLTMVACGGAGNTSISTRFSGGTGTVVILASDQPICDVSSFKVTVTGITLTPQGGGTPVSVLASNTPATLDLASLVDVSTLLSTASISSGTYSQITFTLSNPQLTSVDYTQTPPVPSSITAQLVSSTVTYDITPALSVPSSGSVGLQIDFNLLDSISTDVNGKITGGANLTATATPVSAATNIGFGEIQDLHGLVQSVSTSGTGSFVGSVAVQTAEGRTVTVNVTGSTVLNGVTGGLAAILPQTFVEIAAHVDSSGNLVANRITVEEVDQASVQHAGLIGEVTSVTRLGTGAVSQFTMVVREEFPDVSAAVPLQSSVQVNVPTTLAFNISAPEDDTTQLSFDPTTLGLGQEVTAHGNYVPAQFGVPAVLNATSIYLRTESVLGNFASLITAGLDGKTGGFLFTPCSGVFQGQKISALTSATTDFEGVTDLNTLTTSPTLVLRGQVFFEPTLTTAGTVTLTPPSTVMVVSKVHQFP